MQLLSPRRVQHWAKSYKERAERLRQEMRIHPAGELAIAESKRLGLWEAMEDVDALIVPEELWQAFQVHPGSADKFGSLAPSYRRNVLRWIKLAKTPPTRAKRIDQTVQSTIRNEKLPQM